jgi:hypothetical protein
MFKDSQQEDVRFTDCESCGKEIYIGEEYTDFEGTFLCDSGCLTDHLYNSGIANTRTAGEE